MTQGKWVQQALFEEPFTMLAQVFKTAFRQISFGVPLRLPSWGFPGGAAVKNLPANAGDTGLIPGRGRSHTLRGNQAGVPQLPSPLL